MNICLKNPKSFLGIKIHFKKLHTHTHTHKINKNIYVYVYQYLLLKKKANKHFLCQVHW